MLAITKLPILKTWSFLIITLVILCFGFTMATIFLGRLIDRHSILAYVGGTSDGLMEIYVMDTNFAFSLNLTHHPAKYDNPAWSPDGNFIVFESLSLIPNQGFEISIIPMSGGEIAHLGDDYDLETYRRVAGWSTEGILVEDFPRMFSSAGYSLSIMNSQGVFLRTLTTNTLNHNYPAYPIWSSARGQLAFVSDRDKSQNFPKIYGTDSKMSYIYQIHCGDYSPFYSMTWSPDGLKLAFGAMAPQGTQIFVCDLSTGDVHQLTNMSNFFNFFPSWSSDGEQIAFMAGGPGIPNAIIYTINADGTNLHMLTENALFPVWRP